MSRVLLISSSCVLVLLLCFSQECLCSGRHLRSIDDHAMDVDKAKLPSHSTIKGFGNKPLTVHDELDHKMNEDEYQKQKGDGSKHKKDMIKDQKVKKVKEVDPKSITFRVPVEHQKIHQQPGFNLDYSPPKTHPPSHN
ncbi:uncharacterized protein LOC110863755 [Helianthus annuus]|uniref:uncharacterized protein LOC110863755 n=1 Tax=Helianthus annuus TaxID=4232 RepID=UPI000B8F7A4A|nr:uncharacterized protein LOC110863755 [Helianthus annuus]